MKVPKMSKTAESFMDKAVAMAVEIGPNPRVFRRMRAEHGTMETVLRLVMTVDLQEGFLRVKDQDMEKYCVEAFALQFLHEFPEDTRVRLKKYAEARLELLKKLKKLEKV